MSSSNQRRAVFENAVSKGIDALTLLLVALLALALTFPQYVDPGEAYFGLIPLAGFLVVAVAYYLSKIG